MVKLPAFVDLHVHFREPGQTWKETILTGSRAAARGGYTLVCAMPNLDPVPDTPEHLAIEQAAIDKDAIIDVLPYCSITKGRKGLELVDFHALKGSCVAFSDDGSGVQNDDMMRQAMEAAAREHGLPGRMIPVPSEIDAGCGFAWRCELAERDALLTGAKERGLAYEGAFEVAMY